MDFFSMMMGGGMAGGRMPGQRGGGGTSIFEQAATGSLASIEKDANKHAKDTNDAGDTLLHTVAFRGNKAASATLTLISAGADPMAANQVGRTPLMNAALGNSFELITLLLSSAPSGDSGAMLRQVDCNGHTALHHACREGAAKAIEAMLSAIGDDNLQAKRELADARDRDGFTALGIAAMFGHTGIIRQLLGVGASTSCAKPEEGVPRLLGAELSPAEIALEHGHEEAAMVLLEAADAPGPSMSVIEMPAGASASGSPSTSEVAGGEDKGNGEGKGESQPSSGDSEGGSGSGSGSGDGQPAAAPGASPP